MVENRDNGILPYDEVRKALLSKVAVLLFNEHWQKESGTMGGNDQDPYVEAVAIHIWPEAFFDRVKARCIIEGLQIPGFGIQLVDQLGQPIDPFIRLVVPASRREEFLEQWEGINNGMLIEEQQATFGKGLPLPAGAFPYLHLTNSQIREAISLAEQKSRSNRAIQAQSSASAYPMPIYQQRLNWFFNRVADYLSERHQRAIDSAQQIDSAVIRAIITAPSILGRGYMEMFRLLAKFTGPTVGDQRIEPRTSRSRTEGSADDLVLSSRGSL